MTVMPLHQIMAAIERLAGVPLADQYQTFLVGYGGKFVGNSVRFYSTDELVERNECYQTQEYCPGFLTIGDDSGGRAIIIDPQMASPAVFVVDHGSMSPDDFELISESLFDWVSKGCPL
jgi:hypothetical protein